MFLCDFVLQLVQFVDRVPAHHGGGWRLTKFPICLHAHLMDVFVPCVTLIFFSLRS